MNILHAWKSIEISFTRKKEKRQTNASPSCYAFATTSIAKVFRKSFFGLISARAQEQTILSNLVVM